MGPVKLSAEILDEVLFQQMTSWMITEEKMIVIFVVSTGWTVLTMARIATMNNMTNWEKSMRPFDVEGGAMTIFLQEISVEFPVDIGRR